MSDSLTLTLSFPFILLGRRNVYDPADTTTEPVEIVFQTLQKYCPSIPLLSWALDTSSPHLISAAKQQYHNFRESATWTLRPAPCSTPFLSSFDTPSGWHATDTHLTAKETKGLNDSIWACSFILQRFSIPTDTTRPSWTQFARETHSIFSVLEKAFVQLEASVDGVRGKAKIWDLVPGENCSLRIEVGCADGALATRVCMIMAAFERELDMLRCTEEVVRFVGVGRWLEGVLLRQMAREMGGAWRSSGSGGEEGRCKKTMGREREWWDVVGGMAEAEILHEMQRVEACGTRLAVDVRSDRDGEHRIVIQGQRSTLDPEYLVAYTELLARIVDMAQQNDTDGLKESLEDFQLPQSNEPIDRFSGMLDFLAQAGTQFDSTSRASLLAHLTHFTKSTDSSQTASKLPFPQPARPPQAIDPFYKLRTYIESTHAGSETNMVQFVERYDRAGGYLPTSKEKLSAMLGAEERRRKAQSGQKKGLSK